MVTPVVYRRDAVSVKNLPHKMGTFFCDGVLLAVLMCHNCANGGVAWDWT